MPLLQGYEKEGLQYRVSAIKIKLFPSKAYIRRPVNTMNLFESTNDFLTLYYWHPVISYYGMMTYSNVRLNINIFKWKIWHITCELIFKAIKKKEKIFILYKGFNNGATLVLSSLMDCNQSCRFFGGKFGWANMDWQVARENSFSLCAHYCPLSWSIRDEPWWKDKDQRA